MRRETWAVTGIGGLLLVAAAWVAWGIATGAAQKGATTRSIVGSWDITPVQGDPPGGTAPLLLQIYASGEQLTADVIWENPDGASAITALRLDPVAGQPATWDTTEFRITLDAPDVLQLGERSDRDPPGDPPWRARATRR